MTKPGIVGRLSIACLAALWLAGCATATHGNFVTATHVEPEGPQAAIRHWPFRAVGGWSRRM